MVTSGRLRGSDPPLGRRADPFYKPAQMPEPVSAINLLPWQPEVPAMTVPGSDVRLQTIISVIVVAWPLHRFEN